jgi:predicted unusual protein kinase regulating ubiquinone biosynthesis (AarF/ABC1/UbiB family)
MPRTAPLAAPPARSTPPVPMSDDAKLPTGRLGRLARLARAGASGGMALLRSDAGSSADKAAAILGQLRGVATKVGQMASYVDGVIPEERREAFETSMARLRAAAPRSSTAQIRGLVEDELRAPIDQRFCEWDDIPLASASIGQVHKARTLEGHRVAVKVQHHGIVEAMEADLKNAGLFDVMTRTFGLGKLEVGRLVQEARTRFREELDYELEARRQQAFAALHADDPRIVIPAVIGSHSTRRVLTTALMDGLPFTEACAAAPEDRRRWCETLWHFVYGSIMVGGMFNADPHPGNYFMQPDGRVVFFDFGCVETISLPRRELILRAHDAAGERDYPRFDDAAAQMLMVAPGRHRERVLDYMHFALSPVFRSPFRVTRAFAAEVVERFKGMALEFARLPKGEFVQMPPGILFLNRLQFGFFSILARLDVEVDYLEVERGFLARGWEALRRAQSGG